MAVANVKGVPELLKGFIRGKFREVYSHSVLIDWEAKLWEYYQCKDGVPTVVFVDDSGTVRFKTSGKGTESEVKKVSEELLKI